MHLLPGEQGEILGRLEVGSEKVACWSTRAAISLKHVKRERKSYYGRPIGVTNLGPYRKRKWIVGDVMMMYQGDATLTEV